MRRRFVTISLFLAGFVWMAAGGIIAKSTTPTLAIPDEMLLISPALGYADPQDMVDISGTITAIFRAQGSYTFYTNYHKEKDNVIHVSLDLTMTVRYTRMDKSELITTTVQGTKLTTEDSPCYGRDPKKNQYSTGYWYIPARHVVRRETYTGSATQKTNYPSHIKSVTWSREQKLACFQANIGDGDSIHVRAPVKIRTDEDIAYDDEHNRETSDIDTVLMAAIPSHGTSGSRFAQLVNAAVMPELAALGGWIETPSSQGTTSGSFTVPIFFEDIGWHAESIYRASGKDPRKPPESENTIIWPGSLQMTWALGNKLPKGKMTIGPAKSEDYTAWYPVPVDDDRYGLAAKLEFIARIKPEEEGKPAPIGRIHFWLCDVSREKGKCGNYPVDGGAEDDLRFAPDQAGLIVDPGNPRHAYTEKACSSATVDVEALDTGAYGVLQATCDDLGLIAEDERTKLQSISIPLDDNHNHAGDAWEKTMGVYQANFPPTDDNDAEPADQRRNGDGYTFYEEYRGFITRDGFVRTDPRKKDLFVYDPDGLVKKWYEPYNPAKLVLHYIDPSMMKFTGAAKDPDNRWVNCNSSEDKWYARQYALYVKEWPTMSDKVIGEVNWHTLADQLNGITDAYDGFEAPLKKIYIVKIAPGTLEKCLGGIKDAAVKQDTFNKMMATAVIHEIGHGLGIRHHAEGPKETDDSVQGGVFDCAMRYNITAEYEHPELLKAQTRYCRAGETWKNAVTETDDDGNQTTEFQDMPGNDCFGQIEVKSDP